MILEVPVTITIRHREQKWLLKALEREEMEMGMVRAVCDFRQGEKEPEWVSHLFELHLIAVVSGSFNSRKDSSLRLTELGRLVAERLPA